MIAFIQDSKLMGKKARLSSEISYFSPLSAPIRHNTNNEIDENILSHNISFLYESA
jgi:hypothetical protein